MACASLSFAVKKQLPDIPARCFFPDRRPFLPAFPFRCALLAQHFRSNRPFTRRVVSLSPDISVPSVLFPVSSCVARSAFPSRLLRCPFPTRVFANSASFPALLQSVRPSFPPRLSRFPFRRLSSCFVACLLV